MSAGRAKLIVTTGWERTEGEVARAAEVARICGAPLVQRRGFERMLPGRDDLAYVVTSRRERLEDGDLKLGIDAGPLRQKLSQGLDHPMMAAISPGGGPVEVLDATLGLAQDALHVATVLNARVVGIEGSPPVRCLLEAGLPRLAETPLGAAASRIEVVPGRAADVLATMPPDSTDVVYVDPMWKQPGAAVPGYQLLRRVAVHEPLSEALVREALRVARRRVVVKAPPGDQPPAALAGLSPRRTASKRRAFWIVVRR